MRTPHFVAALPILVSLGCDRPNLPPAARSHAGGALTPVALPRPRLPLFERLQREARSRPGGTPRFEDFDGALATAGVTLIGRKQVLAETVGAAYCAAARTTSGLGLAVCEFPSAE